MTELKKGDRVIVREHEATVAWSADSGEGVLVESDDRAFSEYLPLDLVTKIPALIKVGDVISWNDSLHLPLGSVVHVGTTGKPTFIEREGLRGSDGDLSYRADVSNPNHNVTVDFIPATS